MALKQLSILAAVAFFVSIFIIVGILKVPLPDSTQVSSTKWVFWITIGLFGAVGGAISGLYGLKQAYLADAGIPERVLNSSITTAKPLVGFAAAIIIATFLIGGLIQIENTAISNYLAYGLAFISGFSERLIIGVVEKRLS